MPGIVQNVLFSDGFAPLCFNSVDLQGIKFAFSFMDFAFGIQG